MKRRAAQTIRRLEAIGRSLNPYMSCRAVEEMRTTLDEAAEIIRRYNRIPAGIRDYYEAEEGGNGVQL